MKQGLPRWTGPVLVVLSVGALGTLFVRQDTKSDDEKAYTHCLVSRALAGIPLPQSRADCVLPTPAEVKLQAQRSNPVEILALLARCLDPNRSGAQRELCVRAALTPPATTTTTNPRRPNSTTTTKPGGTGASRVPPTSARANEAEAAAAANPFHQPSLLPGTTITVPTITLPTLPDLPTSTTVTIPDLPLP